jgi:hypothetical protein
MSSLSNKVKVSRRFQKAIRVDSDLGNVIALEGYVCPPSATQILNQMATQVADTGQGAFTWTGPYGGGKSSLALLLASLLGQDSAASSIAARLFGSKIAGRILSKIGGKRVVVPVVGRRADPEAAILEAADAVILKTRRRRGDALGALRALADQSEGGVLVILDEMGKFLEHVANGGGGDVYFFQQLAEEASRSKGKILVVGILHQAFDDYAHRLAREVRDEWLKIQGRFADMPLNIAAEEQVELISRAIEVKGRRPPSSKAEQLAAAMRHRHDASGAFARGLAQCWPLDPAVALLLGPLSRRRFGQSQRSVFGFLNSAEPFGFQAFLSSTPEDGEEVYDLPRLWDYLRANLEPSILASPDGHRWALAVDALERCEARGGDAEHADVVKSVALIDLFKERSGLTASQDVLRSCLPAITAKRLAEVLEHLAGMSVTIYKKHLGAFAIYAGSDFDIEAAVLEARSKMTGLDFGRLKSVAALQPILAKRFYHRTGALLWFDVDISPLSNGVETVRAYRPTNGSAGLFMLLIGTESESDQKGRRLAASAAAACGFPAAAGWSRENYSIREAAFELLALESVRTVRSELNGDAVARREVDARIARAGAELEDKLRDAFASAFWIPNVKDADGGEIRVESDNGSVTLNLLASKLAEASFNQMPIVHNELLNRIKPSSNAIAAQKALLRAMVEHHAEPRLGMSGFPAEAGLYAALLERSGLHVPDHDRFGAYRFVAPDPVNASRLSGLWEAATALFAGVGSAQVSMAEVFEIWRATPFGVRDGLLPVLGVAFTLSQMSNLSIYLDGVYQVRVTTMLVDRLTQDSASVRLRWNNLSELQRTVLVKLSEVVAKYGGFGQEMSLPTAFDTAKGLVRLVNELPNWVLRTATLPTAAVHVRNLAKAANDPNKFLLDDLPATLGEEESVAALVDQGLESLLGAYPSLMGNLEAVMLQELRIRGRTKDSLDDLRKRGGVVRNLTGNYRLDAFATRLASYEFVGRDLEPIEGIASLAAGKPARDWVDRDADHARIEIAALAQEFVKAEGFAHVKGRADHRVNVAIYTSDWRKDGPVRAEVDVAATENEKVAELVKKVQAMFELEGIDREVALAVVAELGALAATAPEAHIPAKKRSA